MTIYRNLIIIFLVNYKTIILRKGRAKIKGIKTVKFLLLLCIGASAADALLTFIRFSRGMDDYLFYRQVLSPGLQYIFGALSIIPIIVSVLLFIAILKPNCKRYKQNLKIILIIKIVVLFVCVIFDAIISTAVSDYNIKNIIPNTLLSVLFEIIISAEFILILGILSDKSVEKVAGAVSFIMVAFDFVSTLAGYRSIHWLYEFVVLPKLPGYIAGIAFGIVLMVYPVLSGPVRAKNIASDGGYYE